MFDNKNNKNKNLNIVSEPTISVNDKKDTKCPVIISQTPGYLDSLDNLNDECLLTVIELNDGSPRTDCTEPCIKLNFEKPKKFRINLVKYRNKNQEIRKNKLLEEKENYESRLKRFPGYMIGNLSCISQGDYEKPISSNNEIDQTRNLGKRFSVNISSSSLSIKPKLKSEKLIRKVKYSCQDEALKYFENLSEIKIKTDENFDQMMIKKFPLGNIFKDKIHMKILYIPECEILRKQFIGFYGLNFEKFNIEEFECWCQKNHFFNSKCMYEFYFNNGRTRECSFILNGLMTKYQVGIILSDFFRTGNSAAYRAVVIFGENLLNIKECSEEYKSKIPINIMPYIHENPNDESSLAPDDFEEIDYFRRNYHRLMFSEDVYF